jgi:rubrerythrin
MDRKCVHSCKGLCNALAVAEQREQESLTQYRQYASGCDYPDVKQLLDGLIADRERALRLLRETREMLGEKFNLMDSINDSFA